MASQPAPADSAAIDSGAAPSTAVPPLQDDAVLSGSESDTSQTSAVSSDAPITQESDRITPNDAVELPESTQNIKLPVLDDEDDDDDFIPKGAPLRPTGTTGNMAKPVKR